MSASHLDTAIAAFGAAAAAKLTNVAARGKPEDQLRAPLEQLFGALAALAGFRKGSVVLVGEHSLADLKTRPDYAVTVDGALVGFIEVKAPGKGADPRRFSGHDAAQWKKLRSLPNLLYTDGNSFSLWRNGEPRGELDESLIHLDGDVRTSGDALRAPGSLLWLVQDFLGWQPVAPRTAKALAETTARLCRLLRDEVEEQMEQKNSALTSLADDWRQVLFPKASDREFADGYAQAVTFGLLMARAREIPLDQGLDRVAKALGQRNSLIGTALRLFTDETVDRKALDTSIRTLTRVLDVVDWAKISRGRSEAWLYFYEDFLAVYDNALRKQTGSYYTPPPVVREMVRMTHDVLRSPDYFGLPLGLAAPDVTVADPAMGGGTFLLGVLRRIAETVEADQGAGAVPGAVRAAVERLIGFELQFGPFAVAQLRLIGELVDLTTAEGDAPPPVLPDLNLFLTDTLGNPFAGEEDWIPTTLQPLSDSRKRANEIKRRERITVVIGNPPYKDKAKGMGSWIEGAESSQRGAPLDRWMPPTHWGVGTHTKHLRNLYVYFWRWATWKVFGAGRETTVAEVEAGVRKDGVICFITVAGFLNGPGFQKMRADLRETASDIWIIDASPEGHQPAVSSRVFQGVMQPVCIVLAARKPETSESIPARVRFTALPEGPREGKFDALARLRLDGPEWQECPKPWRAPFLPKAVGAWADYPALEDFFEYDGSGVMPGRTWIIAPDAATLNARWNRLISERDPELQEILFHPHKNGDRTSTKPDRTGGIPNHHPRSIPVSQDTGSAISPTNYAFRSFDRQYLIPDKRLINRENPTLWSWHSATQIYLTAPTDRSATAGPALTFTAVVPDLHHYNGRGGRVFPLWSDASANAPNILPTLTAYLARVYAQPVSAEDVFAYIAGIAAHPGYTARFEDDLVRPGLRIPITADAALFASAARLGRRVVWLHTYGDRAVDPASGRNPGPPRVSGALRPTIPAGAAIPQDADSITYDGAKRRLYIGTGFVENVTPEVWQYEVSGKQVIPQWFSYRRADRSRPKIGDKRDPSPLNEIQSPGWLHSYTSELLNLLHVLTLLVELEPEQADLLEAICEEETIDAETMRSAGAFDAVVIQSKVEGTSTGQGTLL